MECLFEEFFSPQKWCCKNIVIIASTVKQMSLSLKLLYIIYFKCQAIGHGLLAKLIPESTNFHFYKGMEGTIRVLHNVVLPETP